MYIWQIDEVEGAHLDRKRQNRSYIVRCYICWHRKRTFKMSDVGASEMAQSINALAVEA